MHLTKIFLASICLAGFELGGNVSMDQNFQSNSQGFSVAYLVMRADQDGDGVANEFDECPNTPAGVTVDAHGCPIQGGGGGENDPGGDFDGDGVPNYADLCPGTPSGVPVTSNGCPFGETPVGTPGDVDGDGVPNESDLCPNTPPGTTTDPNGCPVE